jgi:PAS domain S-box-containing protein
LFNVRQHDLAEERLRRFLDCSPDGMLIVDDQGRITYANTTVKRILGYETQELVGQPIESLVPAGLRSAHAAARARYTTAPLLRPMGNGLDLRGLRADGTEVPLEIALSPFRDSGADYVLATIRDVTDRKRIEAELRATEEQLRQSQKMEAIGQLAGGIAHDFNNLLMVISGYAETLSEQLDPADPRRTDVEQIRHAGARAADLVHQLLAFSRKQVLQPRVLDLNSVVSQTEGMLRRVLRENIRLVTSLSPELHRIEVDPGQVEQIILNLVVNARDAMPEGGRLTIETANVDLDENYVRDHVFARAGPHVMLGVSDTGNGMDAATRRRIFEPFFTTKGLGKGTGLGLSTVYGIVKQSGGNIWVYSEPGQGTTFKVYFPRTDKDSTLEPEPKAPQRAAIGETSGTILVVEDEPAVRTFVCNVLRKAGYVVLPAGDPDEALSISREHAGRVRLLLTDVVLPRMSGRLLAEKLAVQRPDMRVLYMSGYTDNVIVDRGVLKPGMAFLEKPVMPATLLDKVHEVLSR